MTDIQEAFSAGAVVATVFWLFVWMISALAHEATDDTKDRVLSDCVGRGGTYAQCLRTWEGAPQ